jgi:hypothetical protein
MRSRFDHLGKNIGVEALTPSGRTVAQDEIVSDAHHADLRHEPDPAREAERARLGLLGQIARIVCLIEIYSGAPGEDETLACLGKLIAFRQKRRRDAGKKKRKLQPIEPFVRPFLWIITAGRPAGVLSALAAVLAPGWPRGVYFSPGVLLDARGATLTGLEGAGGLLRVGIVVASELPRDRSTILVRLMAGGPLLSGAIADLGALPPDAHERAVASQILLGLRHVLGSKAKRNAEEQEFIVGMENMVEKLRDEGRQEGRDEGQLAGVRRSIRRVLATRKLTLDAADEARIDACSDLATLERWLEQALAARNAAEALRGNADGARVRRERGSRR